MTPGLFDPVQIGQATASNRVVFGPHVTNLCDGRAIGARHVAYYARRALGGCGLIVTEVASVHASDWPYERAPLASACAHGWADVAVACHGHGALVVAGLGHAGMQGSTAWTQDALWAPSLVAAVATHEQPIEIGDDEIAALLAGFAAAARVAMDAGCDGVELNVGQHSLLRQFCSGLTNQRADRLGADRAALAREAVRIVRATVRTGIVGVRLSADELAPWAGITPDDAPSLAADIASAADYVCVTRGSIYSEAMTQPDSHVAQGFNEEVTTMVTAGLRAAGRTALVCAQGSIVDVDVAARVLEATSCDLVEMTRAQIADPDLCEKGARGEAARIRPCILCNQHCLVRDVRNPIVSCAVNPVAGHELDDARLDVDRAPARTRPARDGIDVLVVGGGVSGLEAARLHALRGDRVVLYERSGALGGALRSAASLPGRSRLHAICDWLVAEATAAGVRIELDHAADDAAMASAAVVIDATGGVPAAVALRDGADGSVAVVDARSVADGMELAIATGDVVVLDPIGGPIGVGVAELAAARGAQVTLVTCDLVAGTQLSATGDLVAANERLAAAGVRVVRHAVAVGIARGAVELEDRFTAARTTVPAAVVIDAGHRVPGAALDGATVIGDAVAPRGLLMAMLEARREAVGPR